MTAKFKASISITTRLGVTLSVWFWMFYLCLLSRTMNPPGDPGETSPWAYFLALASGSLFLIPWRPWIALPLGVCGFFVAVIAADVVATREERRFVEAHRLTGRGPTPRTTFPKHWLAYDANTKRLSGGD